MSLRRLAHTIGPAVVFGIAFLALWELVVKAFDIKPFLLPAPSAIWSALIDRFGDVWDATYQTGTNAFYGLLAGAVLGVLLSFVLMRFRFLDEMVTPLAIALNAIPIIVLVPVLNNMFSATTETPRRMMVMLIVFFIVLVNVAKGLRQVSATHMELMRSYAASPWQVMTKTRIPNAVPYLFTALKIAAPVAVITAFVAEYFGGNQNGLGYGITSSASTSRNDATWAYVVGACALGLSFFLISVGLERYTATRHGLAPQTQQHTGGAAPGGAT
jgi:NitT/TauT family transport system permease protein